jgi:hypothetical protein
LFPFYPEVILKRESSWQWGTSRDSSSEMKGEWKHHCVLVIGICRSVFPKTENQRNAVQIFFQIMKTLHSLFFLLMNYEISEYIHDLVSITDKNSAVNYYLSIFEHRIYQLNVWLHNSAQQYFVALLPELFNLKNCFFIFCLYVWQKHKNNRISLNLET